jgi:hypothetical protein
MTVSVQGIKRRRIRLVELAAQDTQTGECTRKIAAASAQTRIK